MTRQEFKAAIKLAQVQQEQGADYGDLSPFDGFGLKDFQPVTVTLAQVAGLIRWQAGYLCGGWDNEALQEIRGHGRRRFPVV